MLLGRPPRILYSHLELYALPALAGGMATTALLRASTGLVMEAVLLGIWVTVLARIFAYNHGVRLPVFPSAAVFSEAARPRGAAAFAARLEEQRWKQAAGRRALDESLLPSEAVPQSLTMPCCISTAGHSASLAG